MILFEFMKSSRRTILITTFRTLVLLLVLFSLFVLHRLGLFLPEKQAISKDSALYKKSAESPLGNRSLFGLPINLRIPSINVDALIENVGLSPNGEMSGPEKQNNVAWLYLGPRPGNNGSAVIAGHYGWKDGKKSAFDNLYKLKKGDKIYVEDDRGTIISFVVRETKIYDLESDTSDIFNSLDNEAHLNLITCSGIWNKNLKSYSERLVVFTDKE